MDRDELVKLWRDMPGKPVGEENLMRIAKRARELDRALIRRDATEVVAGVLVLAVTWSLSLTAPGWAPKLGAVAMAAGVVYPLARLIGARRRRRGDAADRPVVEQLRRELVSVETQIDLLRSVRYWYLAPLSAGGLLWAISIVSAAPVEPRLLWVMLAVTAAVGCGVFLAVGWAVERMNRTPPLASSSRTGPSSRRCSSSSRRPEPGGFAPPGGTFRAPIASTHKHDLCRVYGLG